MCGHDELSTSAGRFLTSVVCGYSDFLDYGYLFRGLFAGARHRWCSTSARRGLARPLYGYHDFFDGGSFGNFGSFALDYGYFFRGLFAGARHRRCSTSARRCPARLLYGYHDLFYCCSFGNFGGFACLIGYIEGCHFIANGKGNGNGGFHNVHSTRTSHHLGSITGAHGEPFPGEGS
jgi:hypothetical protein